ncbi:MAG: T9SS type A sorting domain-containing protein [Bacteroidota bacterium]|nr:T9SS type A sorting domain-containing protein [Bacteroidota bacterium]
MKRILLIFVMGIMLQSFSYGQGCLPNGIHFGTQAEIDNFPSNYPGCTIIEGDVEIYEMGGMITNLDSLIVLTEIHGALRIGGFPVMYLPLQNLTSLNGLNNLTSIDSSLFIGTTKLSNLNGLEQLTSIGGNLTIGIEAWVSAGNGLLEDISALSNLSSIGGSLTIEHNNSLVTLTGLEGLTTVGGSIFIGENYSLVSLDGLDNLTTIMGGLFIGNDGMFSLPNPSLVSISGLNGLTSIGEDLIIFSDSLISLTGLEGLTNIPGGLEIGAKYNLINLTGLNNLSDIGGYLFIAGNDVLTSLTGLENLSSIGDDLYIQSNPLLSTCAISGICDYLDNPNGTIYINNNATGCNSEQEIDSLCNIPGSIFENDYHHYLQIVPNPANSFIEITNEHNLKITRVNIYNQLGQMLIEREAADSLIDISRLSTGIYFVEIVTDSWKVRKKLVVN